MGKKLDDWENDPARNDFSFAAHQKKIPEKQSEDNTYYDVLGLQDGPKPPPGAVSIAKRDDAIVQSSQNLENDIEIAEEVGENTADNYVDISNTHNNDISDYYSSFADEMDRKDATSSSYYSDDVWSNFDSDTDSGYNTGESYGDMSEGGMGDDGGAEI